MHDAFLKSVFADRRMAEILILFLLEFQRTVERLMALRTTIYAGLTLEGIAAGPDFVRGDPLPELMAQTVDTMLKLRDYPARLMMGGAKTMAEVVDRFQQGMDELVQKGEVRVLRRLAARRFGEETAGELSRLLDEPPGLGDIDRVTDALVECATGDEFIDRVRSD